MMLLLYLEVCLRCSKRC